MKEVVAATEFLQEGGFKTNPCIFKNWDMANVIPKIFGGTILDMGSTTSPILYNVECAKKYGIDPTPEQNKIPGVEYFVGDLLDVPLPGNSLDFITCLSVLEHGVDIHRFARECGRLLKKGGKLFVTFDFWAPKIMLQSDIHLYGVKWTPLGPSDVAFLIHQAMEFSLFLSSDVDLTVGDPIITPENYSPCEPSYTFALLEFVKN